VMNGLEARWPGMRDRLCDTTPAIRRHINVFVDGKRARLDARLEPGADVFILTAISGGWCCGPKVSPERSLRLLSFLPSASVGLERDTLTLADYPGDIVHIFGERCGRAGRYGRDGLTVRFGAYDRLVYRVRMWIGSEGWPHARRHAIRCHSACGLNADRQRKSLNELESVAME
jgi:hypothetical protein